MIKNVFLIMAGGAIGAAARFFLSKSAVRLFGSHFPWGTLIVNLSGCFLIGIAFELAERNIFMTQSMRFFLVTGFLGALTTFSTYAMESVLSSVEGIPVITIINIAANNIGGLVMVVAGIYSVKLFA